MKLILFIKKIGVVCKKSYPYFEITIYIKSFLIYNIIMYISDLIEKRLAKATSHKEVYS